MTMFEWTLLVIAVIAWVGASVTYIRTHRSHEELSEGIEGVVEGSQARPTERSRVAYTPRPGENLASWLRVRLYHCPP